MKKTIILSLILVLFSANLFAENYNSKLNFNTQMFLKMRENTENIKNVIKQNDYFLSVKDGTEFTKIYVKVDSNYSRAALENMGCKELVKTKTIALLSVPVNQIEHISTLDFVKGIEIAIKPQPDLDKALPATNVDKVHQGENLKREYFGKDVIVGVLDYGIDFTHPMFLDKNGKTRIKRAMIHQTIYSDPDSIKNIIKYSSALYQGHGSHVLGIAAGSEVQAKNGIYSGVASESEILVAELSTVTILEAFAYMFDYSKTVGKPIVINNSYGYDVTYSWYMGQSFEYIGNAIEELLDEYPNGKILVFSAGNSGRASGHFYCDIKNNDSAKVSVPTHSYTLKNSQKKVQAANLIFHREKDVKYSFNLKLKKKDSNELINIIDIEPDSENLFDDFPFTKIVAENDTFEIYTGTSEIANSNNHRMVDYGFVVYSYSHNQTDTLICTIYADKSNTLLGWSVSSDAGTYQQVIANSDNVHYTHNHSIGFPGILEKVVTAGAYVSKKSTYYTLMHLLANERDIADFSSIGPTVDGRIKPDITAPGIDVFSAKNGFENSNQQLVVDTTLDNEHYFWTAGGTSMSSPMVTGIIALMLEINPKLTQAEIKDILRITAINDEFTGEVRDNKSPIWGWGKVDAYAIMKHLESTDIKEEQDFIFNFFPNPISNIINIQVDNETGMPYVINVFDESGKLVYLSSIGTEKQIDLSKLNTGAYFIELYNTKTKSIQKIIKE